MSSTLLSPSQRYAAGALFGMALNQAQAHQTKPLDPIPNSDHTSPHQLWVHESSALLRPVYRFLDIDSNSWIALEKIAWSSTAKQDIEGFVKLLSEDATSDMKDFEVALAKSVDALAQSMKENNFEELKENKHRKFEDEYRDEYSTIEPPNAEVENLVMTPGMVSVQDATTNLSENDINNKPLKEVKLLSYKTKVAVFYQLLSACLSDFPKDNEKSDEKRKGYDARYRVALRLLTTWLDLKWNKMVAIETMIACSAMAIIKGKESKEGDDLQSPKSYWEKWKRGGIIGAAALTGGTLMAITGGLAAPAIASGLGALAPTLGGLVPVIGASGFAAAATAAGTAAGSVAVAASFGAAGAGLTGTKMARRTGGIDEFEFKAIGENQNQGRLAVEILVSGFVFEKEDFVKPWDGLCDDMERYALQWESENLIAVSTAIQDWLTSKVATELMKQGAMMTVLSSLLTALAWPAALLTATDFIDSKWSIALDRSDKAGKLLAEALQKGLQGQRNKDQENVEGYLSYTLLPVTLVGFSLGARAIFKCLQHLAEFDHDAELVERVVLFGAPIAIKGEDWEAARKVVAGRFVNVYSANDWMLGVAFRASLLTQGLAGIQPIDAPGIENVNVTDQIEGHSSYLWATQQILNQLQLDSYYPVPKETLIKT